MWTSVLCVQQLLNQLICIHTYKCVYYSTEKQISSWRLESSGRKIVMNGLVACASVRR